MVATLRLKGEKLAQYRALAGLSTNVALANKMAGYDAGNLSRVLRGEQQPGPRFIAALVGAFDGNVTLDDLFEVVNDSDHGSSPDAA
ncbi:MAG TPA: helix-turn-helix transcriptional regulator [Nocardioides sp.]